jgi:hypothetical protein
VPRSLGHCGLEYVERHNIIMATVSPRPSHGGDHVPRIPRPDKERRERAVAWFGVVAILTIAG